MPSKIPLDPSALKLGASSVGYKLLVGYSDAHYSASVLIEMSLPGLRPLDQGIKVCLQLDSIVLRG